jgi:hypothetical protein
LNRFKSGFFVDNFTTTISQKKVTGVKNSIDIFNSELRPTHFTTQTDLLLGTESSIGIGTSPNPNVDTKFSTDLIGSGIKKTGQLLTLDYEEVSEISQPYSTRVQNVTPYNVSFYGGTIDLFPSSDVWVDQVRLEPLTFNAEGNYTETSLQLSKEGFDQQTGFGPVIWGSWKGNIDTSTSTETKNVTIGNAIYKQTIETTTRTGTETRTGTRKVLKEQFDDQSLGDRVLNSEVIAFIRKRNIEITAKRMRPLTRLYPFFDGVDMSNYIVPKLLEINMISGTFQVGETVIGSAFSVDGPQQLIKFRVSQQNHKYGPYDNPSDVFTVSPYDVNITISSDYSSTSTILNVDTYSLSNQPEGNYFGYLINGLSLKGQTSGAEATISNIRLISDNVGTVIASLWIPDPNINTSPKFEAGAKNVRLTSSSTNDLTPGSASTFADENYFAEGKIDTVQESIITIRNAKVDKSTVSESRNVSDSNSKVVDQQLQGYRSSPSPSRSSGSSSPRRYNGFAPATGPTQTGATGIVNQNAGGSQSRAFSGGSGGAVIGAAGLQRALADGYSKSSVKDWINRTGATVGPAARAALGL